MMIYAAILAGGMGKRLNFDFPKQFYEINERPILSYCINQFIKVEEFDKIIVSSPKEYLNETNGLIKKYFDDNRIAVIEGGKTRNDTILKSIDYVRNSINKDSIMVTHDASRIFVTPKLIEDSIRWAIEYGAASPIIPATDVIFQSKNHSELTKIPERRYLYHSQTPQSFNIFNFLEIYNNLSKDEIKLLDEAMMLFYLRDKKVHLFEGSFTNFKITRQFDITIAKAILGDNTDVK